MKYKIVCEIKDTKYKFKKEISSQIIEFSNPISMGDGICFRNGEGNNVSMVVNELIHAPAEKISLVCAVSEYMSDSNKKTAKKSFDDFVKDYLFIEKLGKKK